MFPRRQGRPLRLSRAAYRELFELKMDLWDAREVLEHGTDCSRSPRKAGTVERCLRKKMSEKKELEKETIRCTCGRWTRPRHLRLHGFRVRGSVCPRCGETYLNPEDANRVLLLNKLQKGPLQGRVARAGNSTVVRLPKGLVDALGLRPGETVEISLEGPRKIVLTA